MIKALTDDRKNIIKCAAVCAVCAFLSFIYFIVKGGGFFSLCDDFNVQQIPFTTALSKSLSGGIGEWSWSNDLGVSTIQAYSFYTLGSPFFWLSTLFPAEAFPYVVGWMYMLKYTVAGVTAYLFLRRTAKKSTAAITGAVLYAFSGFQSVNLLFYHFHDVAALFPLLLIGLERMMEDEKDRLLFVFAVFINCLLNYYFFVSEVIFLVIYFLIMHTDGKADVILRRALSCLLCGAWGVAMASVLFVPNVLYMLTNRRISEIDGALNLLPRPWQIVYAARGLLFPGEPMNDWCCLNQMSWNSADCYLPFVSVAPAMAYCLKKRDRLAFLSVALLVISFLPLINSSFVLFTNSYYRWWFMLDLMLALCTVRVMDEPEGYPLGFTCTVTAFLTLLLYGAIIWADRCYLDCPVIFDFGRLTFWAAFTASGVGLSYALLRYERRRTEKTLAAVCLFAVATTFITLYIYSKHGYDNYKNDFELGCSLETIDEQYRYDTVEDTVAVTGGGSSMRMFSSTRAAGSVEFDSLFDYYNSCLSLNKNSYPGLCELFGAKYSVVSLPGDKEPVRVYPYGEGKVYVVEREACPIGFRMDSFIFTDELKTLPVEKRGIALLYAAVVEENDSGGITGAAHADIYEIPLEADISDVVRKNASNAVKEFERDQNGFRCVSDYETDSAVYFSVPYDKGWTACIDGEEQSITDSGGMMLLNVPAGEHSIEFSYVTPGYREGFITSAAAILAFAYSTVARKRKRGRNSRMQALPGNKPV